MKTLEEINEQYREITHSDVKEPAKDWGRSEY